MLMPGVFDLNSAESCTDSLKEVVKQTMLRQDVIFRKQVNELHRLYWIQSSLMEDVNRPDYARCKSWDAKEQSFLLPLTNPTRCDPLSDGTGFSSINNVSTSLVSQELLESHKDACNRLQRRPFNLQLSADEFINNVKDDLPEEGNYWTHLNKPMDFMLSPSCLNCLGTKKLELSLSMGEDGRAVGATRSWLDKKTHSCSQNFIDLEGPAEEVSHGYPRFVQSVSCASLEMYAKNKQKSHIFAVSNEIISTNVEKGECLGISESTPTKEHSKYFQEQTFSGKGIRECHNDIQSFEFSRNLKQCTSYQGDLDLNKVHDDDSSSHSNNPLLVYPSAASSAGVSGVVVDRTGTCAKPLRTEEVDDFSNGTSDVLPHESCTNITIVDVNSKNKSTDIWSRNLKCNATSGGMVRPGSSRPQVDNSKDPKDDNIQLDTKLANGLLSNSISDHLSTATREVSSDGSAVEDTVFSCSEQSHNTFEGGHGNKSPASCKSCISDNYSSSVKTMHSGTLSSVSLEYSGARFGFQLTDFLSEEHDQGTSDGNNLTNKCLNKKEESDEVDFFIQGAAESLINMSVENSATLAKEIENKERDRPEYSFDSFELIAMNLTQSNEDDNCVSSRPYEVTDAEMKDFGFKLRRGRRLKDFQKEILPGIASLSRHEIREDINIMEGVLRSREYRKMTAKMRTSGENCLKMVRSRRSRLNCTGRRNISWKFG